MHKGIYWGYIGRVEKKMETTIVHKVLGLSWENGKENGNYYSTN